MDAVITAGGIPEPGDPLYPTTQGKPKALLEIAGKPMVQWVLDAVADSQTIQNIVVVGLESDSELNCTKPIAFVPNNGSLLNNIRAGVKKVSEINPSTEYTLIVSADIPAITGDMIDWSVNASLETGEDIYYSVIPRDVMEKRFPESRRTYIRLKDMEVCGADINMIRIVIATGRDELWNRLIDARKNAFKQAALIGFDTLILLMLRRLTISKLVRTVARRLDLKGRALVCPYAEIGMDVDKPHQLELLRAYLEERVRT